MLQELFFRGVAHFQGELARALAARDEEAAAYAREKIAGLLRRADHFEVVQAAV